MQPGTMQIAKKAAQQLIHIQVQGYKIKLVTLNQGWIQAVDKRKQKENRRQIQYQRAGLQVFLWSHFPMDTICRE